MARAISDEELQLKKRARRRLIGAVILVTVVVVALPMVLDSEPKSETQDINIRIPSTDAGPFAPKAPPPALPAAEKPTAEKAAAVEPRIQKPQSAPAKAPAAPPAKPEKSAPAPKTAAAKAAPKAADPVEPKEFVVQVIALADAGKAKALQQQVAASGIKSYTEVVATEKGDVTRVRAGPFASREAAEKARGQLKAIGLDGKVMPK